VHQHVQPQQPSSQPLCMAGRCAVVARDWTPQALSCITFYFHLTSLLMHPDACLVLHAGADEGDRHHLFAFSGARSSSGARNGSWGAAAGQAQVVELMERHSVSASAHYIEERLRRRGRTDSQEDQPSSSSNGDPGTGGSSSSSFVGFDRQPLFAGAGASAAQAQALAKEGGRHLRHWKESLLQKLKRVASQPALAVPSSAVSSMQQLGQAAVATAPLLGSAVDARSDRSTTARQRPSSASQKADKAS
jgi:hypothetical protein